MPNNPAAASLPASLGTLLDQPRDRPSQTQRVTVEDWHLAGTAGFKAAPELCTLVDQYKPDLLPRDAIAEVKVDGIRCLYINGAFWTREGCPLEAANHCLPMVKAIEAGFGRPMFFDGEYVEDGGLEATVSAFRSRKGAGDLWLFDAVPLDQWASGGPSNRSLFERKRDLRANLMPVIANGPGPVGFIESFIVAAASHVETMAQTVWAQGSEGLVIKSTASRYLRKRTCDWMKVKLRTVSTVEVVDVIGCTRAVEFVFGGDRVVEDRQYAKTLLVRIPGRGNISGQPCRPMRLNVPAGGLSESIWERRADLVGSTVEIEHAGFTGAGNPREAVLKTVRI